MSSITQLVSVPVGVKFRYEYPESIDLDSSEITYRVIVGEKLAPIHTDEESVGLAMRLGNQGFYVRCETGETVSVSRYARVEVL